ncbi:MAG: GNAT family N-acetyltransferase [Planctomycetes bacterium]|nr:GNAT family N-acetyltransferase [Planctomycetota bacterium]
MAELVNIAGDGLPLYLWATFARPEQSAWDVGRERARLGLGGFAYKNTVVREVVGKVAACLIGYPNSDSPPPPSGLALPGPLVPLMELSNFVTSTWYLNVLATFPDHRGKGYATELLQFAESMARDSGHSQMSLIMSDANAGARRMYEKNGFAEYACRPIVKDKWEHAGQNWILMVRDL